MELAAYLGTVSATVTLALGSMWVVTSVLGRRIDDLGSSLGRRIDDLGSSLNSRIDDVATSLGSRLDRLEGQNDAIPGAVSDLGQRVAQLEARDS